ncbi:MAG TPA: gamma-glutamyl-gamma-aminobutyrate hydrolase family protein [Dehalococcoidia bacterium]|nr:gamma-glutamyl-gamma-aminobutyrate hydrolase family protein [Dehalococcoidia bacterium]
MTAPAKPGRELDAPASESGRRRILVLETMPPVSWLGAESNGTGWLRRLLPDSELVGVPAYDGRSPLPKTAGFVAAIVPGSLAAVYERAPWMLRLEAYLRGLHAAGFPVLGICFGHQILASALGGAVVRNPLGREFGFCELRLTDAGRAHPTLFAGLPHVFRGAQGHYDVVSELPPGAALLAESDHGVQSFAHGSVLGVQFHPEISGAVLAAIAEHDAAELAAAGQDVTALAAELRTIDLSEASAVVPNFVAGLSALTLGPSPNPGRGETQLGAARTPSG